MAACPPLSKVKGRLPHILVIALLIWVWTGLACARGFVVDHSSISLFERIPERYLEAARNLRVLFMDRSVGVNTNDALNCFTVGRYGAAPVVCRRDYRELAGAWRMMTRTDEDLSRGLVPPAIRFTPDPRRYDRSNWRFFIFAGPWTRMMEDFVGGLHEGSIPAKVHPGGESIRIDPMDFDVLSFQFGYLNLMEGSRIAELFTHRPGEYDDFYDLEREVKDRLATATPPRVFVYWTTNLARAIGSEVSTEFNRKMRQWSAENDEILFDFADIQSHDMKGDPCFDNRDGVPYTTPSGNKSENHPDDGQSLPAICQEDTIETDGGHLATAQGTVSVAKGLWVLVARIAGWDPENGSNP
ncbi:MAG: hypothetical protein WAO20_14920 [Acidobacteriota bacterium]